jgi:hypothetical protein
MSLLCALVSLAQDTYPYIDVTPFSNPKGRHRLGASFTFHKDRADMDSAKVIGQPKVMAEALKKIGFRRLFPLYTREPEFSGYRRSEWFRFDPHPPAYHRIAQLENLKEPERIQHTFFRTVKENLKGVIMGT